ncbi:MFS transporter [Citricoccus sp. NPDC079358]|uniref:MFS transporter n=1 Tax=Citricoccus sp. NPDC079358 TaxID=3154653 RepID=UPI00344D8DAF
MTDLTGLSESAVPWVLVCFGVGMTLGSLIAGPLVDRSIEKSAVGGVISLGLVLLAFATLAHVPAVTIACVLLLGVAGSLFTTALQVRLLRESGDAPSVSAAMNHAAFNFANALGAFLGAVVVDAGLGYRSPALLGTALTVVGLAIMILAVVTHRRARTGPVPSPGR